MYISRHKLLSKSWSSLNTKDALADMFIWERATLKSIIILEVSICCSDKSKSRHQFKHDPGCCNQSFSILLFTENRKQVEWTCVVLFWSLKLNLTLILHENNVQNYVALLATILALALENCAPEMQDIRHARHGICLDACSSSCCYAPRVACRIFLKPQ